MRTQRCNLGGAGGGVSKGWDPARYEPAGILRVVVAYEVVKHLLLAHQLLTLSACINTNVHVHARTYM